MKIKLLLSSLFILSLTFSSFSQEVKKKTYEIQNSTCKGKIVLDFTTRRITVEIKGKCEYKDTYSGPFEVLEDGAVRVVFSEKAAKKYLKKEVVIKDECFTWSVNTRFCEK